MRLFAVFVMCSCGLTAAAASYCTYIGDVYPYEIAAVATDANGNVFITGSRAVQTLPGQYVERQVSDVFVAKVDHSGNLTLIATFSGKGTDRANAIALDPSGNIYIAGNTTSGDFPLRNPVQSVPYTVAPGNYATTGFLMKLTPDGGIIYSTYLGGTQGFSVLNAIAADATGNAYVTGNTGALDYQHTAGLPAGQVSASPVGAITAAFFAKVGPQGGTVAYAGAISGSPYCEAGFATCQGNTDNSSGNAIAVDSAGNAYVAANTNGGLTGTQGALVAAGTGAFILKINAAGTGLDYLTLLGAGITQPGGSGIIPNTTAYAIAVNTAGEALISGSTSDANFPATEGAYQTKLANAAGGFVYPDAFVAELNATGSAMLWATYLGGPGNDAAQTVAVDPSGDVWVSGTTFNGSFPTAHSIASAGTEFLAELNSTGSTLLYSAQLPAYTVAASLAVDSAGTVHTAGSDGLVSSFPVDAAPGETSAPWFFGLINSAGGSLSGRIAPGELITLYGLQLGPATPAYAVFDSAGFLPTSLGGIQVTIGGIAAPLLYASGTQINAVAPVEVTAGSPVSVQISNATTSLPAFRAMVDSSDPEVFQTALGFAAAINQDGTINSQTNPAPVGSYVEVWATGTGFFPGRDGQLAPGAAEFCTENLFYCQVYASDGTPVTVYYTGAAPGTVTGVMQIDFQVTSSQNYYFSVGTLNSQNFIVATQ